ncbi:MAG: T9SS type A sorting domain-containing protein [Candidatus Eisenbacteria sp.]|nr:T9SS type A sorting domain-containing protein [Candidatus Eisenbacteria bacterium]
MAKQMTLTLCLLLVGALLPLAGLASAADRYEVVVEYNGPYFNVVNADGIDQLVDDPIHEYAFQNVYGVAVSKEAGGRIMNYVLDSGNNRILGYETQIDVNRLSSTTATWTDPRAAASQWDDEGINLAEWAGAATNWVIPYSEVLRVNGATWQYVADLSLYGANDHVYTVDYDDAANAPELAVVTGALSDTDIWELSYCVTNYQGGGTAAFGLGDIDQDNSDGAALATVLIDQASPTAISFQDLRCIFTLPNQTTATTDELWLIDAADNSPAQNQELIVYTATQGTAVEAFLEAYDDVLVDPRAVYVAADAADTYADPTYTAAAGIAHFTAIAIVDENQVTGHTYSIDMTGGNVTITDLTTGRVLVAAAAKADFVTGAANCFVIPGLGIDFTVIVADDTDATFVTGRAVPSRYAFVCDRGNDRIKVVSVGDISATTGDDLPGDPHTCVVQPSGAGTIGATADQDYYFTTPGTVPENWKTGTATRPIKEGSLDTITGDPAGTPVTWTRIDDLATAGPTDKVFQLDWWEGVILFGDGVHGELPPATTAFSATYTTTPDVMRYGNTGSGAGQFLNPEGVCAAWNAGLGCFIVYVADTGNDRIQKLRFYPEDAALGVPPRMEFVCSWATGSGAEDPLTGPGAIDVASDGSNTFVAVADRSDRVILYDDADFEGYSSTVPVFETSIGGSGNALGFYSAISAVDLLPNGTELEVYVSDGQRNVVTKYVLAPEPTITLVCSGDAALPASFPPTASYPVTYTVSNAPEGAYVMVSFADTPTPDFDDPDAFLSCFDEMLGIEDSPATWVFSESPDGTPADGDYWIFAGLFDAGGNFLAGDGSDALEILTIDSNLIQSLLVRDRFDDDPTLLIAPNQTRAIALELAYPENVIGCGFTGAFPNDFLEVVSVTPGPGFEGTDYIQHVWNATFDNTAGTYVVNTSVTGAPVGLSANGTHAMAFINVRPVAGALTDTVRVRFAEFTLDAEASQITDVAGNHPDAWTARALAVKLAYVGDVAHATAGTDSTVPNLQPNPDGFMTFADQMAFTLGWNGSGGVRDPIADMGPVSGTAPNLLPAPDGLWTLDDLLAFTTNWSWFGSHGFSVAAAGGGALITAFSPLGAPVDGEARVAVTSHLASPLPDNILTLDIGVEAVQALTGAMVRIAYNPVELTLVDVERGDFLTQGQAAQLFNTIQRDGVCEVCATRLDPEQPGVSGAGTLARLSFRVLAPPETGVTYAYDLRDTNNNVLARGTADLLAAGSTTAGQRVVLCQNYPNPISPSTSIVFALPQQERVDLAVYDLTGRRIKTLVRGARDAGVHAIEWDGRDEWGATAASGVYFYKLRVGETVQTRKLVIAH